MRKWFSMIHRLGRHLPVLGLGLLVLTIAYVFSFRSKVQAADSVFLGFDSDQVRKQREKNLEIAERYLSTLNANERRIVLDAIHDVRSSTEDLIPLMNSEVGEPRKDEDVFLIIQGYDLNDLFVFYEPFHVLWQQQRLTYFYRWSVHKSMNENANLLNMSLMSLAAQYSGHKIVVIAYSSGGVVALAAMDRLRSSRNRIADTVYIHTIASPVFGFNAPPFVTYFGAPFVGIASAEMGIGVYDRLVNRPFSGCENWITTSCDLDVIACRAKGHVMYPQTGKITAKQELPCGNWNAHYFDNESHTTILARVVREVLGRLP